MYNEDKKPEPLEEQDLDQVAGGAIANSPPVGQTIYQGYGYGYGTPSVWPPVDPNTASGLPPMVKPGGPPPGY